MFFNHPAVNLKGPIPCILVFLFITSTESQQSLKFTSIIKEEDLKDSYTVFYLQVLNFMVLPNKSTFKPYHTLFHGMNSISFINDMGPLNVQLRYLNEKLDGYNKAI